MGVFCLCSLLPVSPWLTRLRPVPRRPPAGQGPVRAPVLQPGQLRLPAAVRVPLEEPAPLLHDRGRGAADTPTCLSRFLRV